MSILNGYKTILLREKMWAPPFLTYGSSNNTQNTHTPANAGSDRHREAPCQYIIDRPRPEPGEAGKYQDGT